MQKPNAFRALEALGRVRLSESFFMRDMLYSEISNYYGIPNIPENPELAIQAGKNLCQLVLEPLQERLGRISIRSAYRSPEVNQFGNQNALGCSSNKRNASRHIWDQKDKNGCVGAMATVVVQGYIPYYEQTGDWKALAWYIHDNVPYSYMCFYPKLGAFNIGWHERPQRRIDSHVTPRGCLTKPGMENHSGTHSEAYLAMLKMHKNY
ncbi:hypothetical protein [Litorimonas haliclonae]|uniref:hypothetical protein n=1 Tax=Litorimonas haliclonae TaxID=2081977 RepID=UPI0039F0D77C